MASADNSRSQMLSLRSNGFDSAFTDSKSESSEKFSDTSKFCDEKIDENLNLLEENEISFDQKKSAYTTLAECYELKRNWQKALDNYTTLKGFDTAKEVYYQKKIDFIFDNHLQR